MRDRRARPDGDRRRAGRLAADRRRRLHRQPRARGGRAARGRDRGSPEPAAREPVARDRARPPPAHRSPARRPDMDARVFRRVQRYGWDAATNAYDRGWVPQLERLTESCVARAALRAGERVLDLATGTGVGAFAAARAVGAAGSVTGIDVSEKMVALASRRAADARRPQRRLPAPRHGGDRRRRRRVRRGHLRVRPDVRRRSRGRVRARSPASPRPGGRVSVCVWGRRAACGFAEVFPIVDAHVDSEVCPLFFALGRSGRAHRVVRAGGADRRGRGERPGDAVVGVRGRGLRGDAGGRARSRSPGTGSRPRRGRSCAPSTWRRSSRSAAAIATTFPPRSCSRPRASRREAASSDGTFRSALGHASRLKADGKKPEAKTREQGDRS